MQIDIKIVSGSVWPNHDLLDQSANAAHRFFLRFFIGKAFDELRDGGAIAFAHPGLNQLRFQFSAGEFRLDGVAALDCCVEIGFDFGRLNGARADHLDQLVAFGYDPCQLLFKVAPLRALLFASRGEFSRIFLAEHFKQFWIEHIIAQAREDYVFQALVRHGEPIGAESLVLIRRAAEMIARVLRIGAATDAALDDA